MQVKFHNSVLHFELCPFLGLLIYLRPILDNMSGLLYKFYTNERISSKCSTQLGNVQNHPSYPCTSFVKDIGGGESSSSFLYLHRTVWEMGLFLSLVYLDIKLMCN